MKILLKILVAPIILTLILFIWICSALLYCSAFVFGLISTIIGLLGKLQNFRYWIQDGIYG